VHAQRAVLAADDEVLATGFAASHTETSAAPVHAQRAAVPAYDEALATGLAASHTETPPAPVHAQRSAFAAADEALATALAASQQEFERWEACELERALQFSQQDLIEEQLKASWPLCFVKSCGRRTREPLRSIHTDCPHVACSLEHKLALDDEWITIRHELRELDEWIDDEWITIDAIIA